MGWDSSYIPDLTERFPEGFGGADLTDSFYPSHTTSLDPWAFLDAEYSEYAIDVAKPTVDDSRDC